MIRGGGGGFGKMCSTQLVNMSTTADKYTFTLTPFLPLKLPKEASFVLSSPPFQPSAHTIFRFSFGFLTNPTPNVFSPIPISPYFHLFTSHPGRKRKKNTIKKENNIAETHSGVIRRQSIRSERCHLGDAYVLHDFSSTTIYIHLLELAFFFN